MPTLNVTSRDGDRKSLAAKAGSTLMEALQNAGLVEGTCGGAASCGTCHIYFKDKDLTSQRTEDEGYMLEGLEEFVDIRKGSRLSCQITVNAEHDGAEIEIAPEA